MTKLAVLTLMIFNIAVSAAAQDTDSENPKVALMVYLINSASGDANIEDFLAQELVTVVVREWEREPDPSIVELTATLLDHPASWVVSYAAIPLGRIGPGAAAATPALLRALDMAPDTLPDSILAPSAFVGDVICGTLEEIGTTPEGAPCMNGFYKYY